MVFMTGFLNSSETAIAEVILTLFGSSAAL
jgi:hypothetical protein